MQDQRPCTQTQGLLSHREPLGTSAVGGLSPQPCVERPRAAGALLAEDSGSLEEFNFRPLGWGKVSEWPGTQQPPGQAAQARVARQEAGRLAGEQRNSRGSVFQETARVCEAARSKECAVSRSRRQEVALRSKSQVGQAQPPP